jgi:hypothetical protein
MSFKETLLMELHKEAPGIARRSRRRRNAVRAAAVTGGTTALAVATVAGVLTGGTRSGGPTTQAAAYTINERGTKIEVKIRELRNPDRLQADLAKLGVKADIVYLPADKTCQEPRYVQYYQSPAHRPQPIIRLLSSSRFEFDKRDLPKNTTLLLTLNAGWGNNLWSIISEGLTSQPIKPCKPTAWPKKPPSVPSHK